jgi:sulfatase modifying factor 1
MRRLLALAAVGLLSSCGLLDEEKLPPEGQLLLFVDTDAIVPLAPGEVPDDITPAPLFDRLSIAMFAPGEEVPCTDCTREFPISRRAFAEGSVSAGLLPKPGVTGYRARISLYRSGGSSLAGARPASTIVHTVALPATSGEGIVTGHVVLKTEEVGAPRGTLEEPLPLAAGKPGASLVDTFAREQRRGCEEAPREGEVCVPGGAFWFGDLAVSVPREQLVVVSPFFLDSTEVTVARVRASSFGKTIRAKTDYIPRDAERPFCTYTPTPEDFEELPAACFPHDFARKFCETSGGRLPTEAELAYVISGRVSASFVWGNDVPSCTDAVIARNIPTSPDGARFCSSLGIGPAKVGTSVRDVLTLPTGKIFDLTGNVCEFAADDFTELDSSCWKDTILYDPLCKAGGKLASSRGASWYDSLGGSASVTRTSIDRTSAALEIGFRCAR